MERYLVKMKLPNAYDKIETPRQSILDSLQAKRKHENAFSSPVPQLRQNVSQNVSQNDVLRMRQQFERGNYSQDSSGSGRIIAFACLGFVFASFCANMFYIKNPPECAEDSDDEDEQEKKKKCKKDRFERTVTAGIVGAVFGVILYFVNGS